MGDQDVSNYSSSSSHRLPTVSASQALQSLTSSRSRPISTGLKQLDATLLGIHSTGLEQHFSSGGLSRGQVTEVYGPPGVGKTTFAMQLCANALHSGDRVLWVDCAYSLVGPRLKEILSGFRSPAHDEPPSSPPVARSADDLLDQFDHYQTPTLPHLLALLLHPSPNFPPEKTSLLIVDSVSTVFATAFPRSIDAADGKASGKKNDTTTWAANRRWSIMGDFVSKLGKLAVTKNIAVLLTSQTATKVRAETGAVLRAAVSGTAWDGGIASHILLFRDWPPEHEGSQEAEVNRMHGVRYARVLKAGGVGGVRGSSGGVGKMVAFTITNTGLCELESTTIAPDVVSLPIISVPPLKRKRDEIADSQSEDEELGSDEEFGWTDGNELPNEGPGNDNDVIIDKEDDPASIPPGSDTNR